MTSQQTRSAFLEFFAQRQHRIVPSSPLVLPNDPTLLFANAGMNQFKDVFTGKEQRSYQRAVSAQKCLRVSGKHNDLEMVGRTPRHHTFFEMLGNFSFGDYFKEEAIAFAWELLTDGFGLPAESLWVTVFGGSDETAADDEALAIWRDRIGVPPQRILRLGEKENFWRMGDSGPCGPCSELHFDLGEDLSSMGEASTPETDEQRFIEVWNLVFMQFEQLADGSMRDLPRPSIDTGMGLERMVSVLQHKRSNYDTDLFRPILEAAASRAGVRYGEQKEQDFSLRVIADHLRALCFLVADGVVPANDKRGYVLRRLLRRAIRHGRKLGLSEPFFHEITPIIVENLGTVYPELLAAADAVVEVGRREEERFGETLSTGWVMLEEALSTAARGDDRPPLLPGRELFRLYDTFGFPLDLAREIAQERGVRLDEEGFEREMARQRARAKASWERGAREQLDASLATLPESWRTRFEGYTHTRLDGLSLLGLLRDGRPVELLEEGQQGHVVLEATPFYSEAGGQVADTGVLAARQGRARVDDVQRPAAGLILHEVHVEAGRLQAGDRISAEVDERRRDAIRRNHTATHLLHAALREVVGTHVKQAGSLVAAERLRFDFTHFAPLTPRAIADLESLINQKVLEDLEVETEVMPLDRALRRGAMALFGEKYEERVRVVRVGDFSLELCGGTHCGRTGEIGLVKLTQERGIASGTRRLEALSGEGALLEFREAQAIVRALEEQLAVSRDQIVPEISRRLDHARTLQRELEQQRLRLLRERLLEAADKAPLVEGVRVVAQRVEGVGAPQLRELADAVRGRLGSGVVILGRAEAEKASLLIAVSEDLAARLPAGKLVGSLGAIIGGRGGGRPDLAEAGGKRPERLDEALAAGVREVARRASKHS